MDGQQHPRPLRVGILGHYHGGNLGDEVIVASLIHNIRARRPDAELFGVSLRPADTSTRHGIPAISMATGVQYRGGERVIGRAEEPGPLGRVAEALARADDALPRRAARKARSLSSVVRTLQTLQEADMLLVAGSGPLFDGWKGPWVHPFNLFKWSIIARATRTAFVPLSVGAGPIDAPLSRFFVRWALKLAYYRSFRDPGSAALVRALGVEGRRPIFPDLGFSLPDADIAPRRQAAATHEQTGTIGISTVAHQDPRYLPHGAAHKYEAYLEKLTDFAAWLLERGYTLRLLRSQVQADERVAVDLQERLRAAGFALDERVVAPPTRTYRDLLDQMVPCELVVGGRFHCHVLPFLLDKPVLGVAYHTKTFDLMEYMGQSAFCLDIDRMTPSLMIARFRQLREQRAAASAIIAERVRACRAALDLQYDRLLSGTRPDFEGSYLLPGASPSTDVPELQANPSDRVS